MKNRSNGPTSVPSLPYPEVRLDPEEDLPLVEYPEQAPDPRFAFQARPRDWSSRIEPFDDRPPRPGPIAPPRPRVPLTRDLIRPNFFGQYFGRYGSPPLAPRWRSNVVRLAWPLFEVSLEADVSQPGRFLYPLGCRLNASYVPETKTVVVGFVEAAASGRRFSVAHISVLEGPSFGRVLSVPPLVAAEGGRPQTAADQASASFGLRSSQVAHVSAVARRNLLFPVVDSVPYYPAQHSLIATSGSPLDGIEVLAIAGLTNPLAAPAGLAVGSDGFTERIAFAYAQGDGLRTRVELGFLQPAIPGTWEFRPRGSVPVPPPVGAVSGPNPISDNVAVHFDPILAEWIVAFVPSGYSPGAFGARFRFDGTDAPLR